MQQSWWIYLKFKQSIHKFSHTYKKYDYKWNLINNIQRSTAILISQLFFMNVIGF